MEQAGRVYLISDGEAVKIGFSFQPIIRKKQLQTGSSKDIEILGTWPGTLRLEQSLHALFEPARIRGEWYDKDIVPIFFEIAKENFKGHKR